MLPVLIVTSNGLDVLILAPFGSKMAFTLIEGTEAAKAISSKSPKPFCRLTVPVPLKSKSVPFASVPTTLMRVLESFHKRLSY